MPRLSFCSLGPSRIASPGRTARGAHSPSGGGSSVTRQPSLAHASSAKTATAARGAAQSPQEGHRGHSESHRAACSGNASAGGGALAAPAARVCTNTLAAFATCTPPARRPLPPLPPLSASAAQQARMFDLHHAAGMRGGCPRRWRHEGSPRARVCPKSTPWQPGAHLSVWLSGVGTPKWQRVERG